MRKLIFIFIVLFTILTSCDPPRAFTRNPSYWYLKNLTEEKIQVKVRTRQEKMVAPGDSLEIELMSYPTHGGYDAFYYFLKRGHIDHYITLLSEDGVFLKEWGLSEYDKDKEGRQLSNKNLWRVYSSALGDRKKFCYVFDILPEDILSKGGQCL